MEAGQIKTVIERALVSFTGQTTSAGNVGGTTLVCSDLTTRPDFDGQKVIIADGSYAGQVRDISESTTGGTVTVSSAFGGQIIAGVNFYVIADLPMTEEAAAITSELAKVPKSDAAVTWNATARASINTEVDSALDTPVPGVPTADSLNERIKALDDAYTAARAAYLDELAAANVPADIDTLLSRLTAARALLLDQITALRMAELDAANIPADIDTLLTRLSALRAGYLDELAAANIPADADPRVMGRSQVIEVSITSAANAGDVVVATITTQPCQIESVTIHADAAQTANMTSCGVFGGAGKVITFISAADATQANLNAADKQVAWSGVVRLAATKTIVISLVGTGAAAVDLTIVIKYRSCIAGGYLA